MPSSIEVGSENRLAAPRFEASGVDVAYGGVAALVDARLSVEAGTIVGLIGSNGAGKSTLFDVLTGFLMPNRGEVHLDGVDITARSATWRARQGIRRTFQRQQVFGNLSVRDNVRVALDWEEALHRRWFTALVGHKPTPKHVALEDRVDDVMARCGLEELGGRAAAHMTIGDARMLELARAIVVEPRVLLLDEPTSGLGDAEKDNFASVVQGIMEESNCAVILVEHDIPFVMQHCSEVNVLHLGSIIAKGTPSEVVDDAVVRSAYLD